MNPKYIKYLFFVISIIDIFSQIDYLDFHFINSFTKPMLMPVLALYFYFEIKEVTNPKKITLLAALFFAWLGDVFLMFQKYSPQYFMFGLGSFLVMQLCYIYLFRPISFKNMVGVSWYSLAVLMFGAYVLSIIFPNLANLKIPVILYFTAILLMVLAALSQWERIMCNAAKTVFFGAVLFMISDSIIALNKFSNPIFLSGFFVMATYIIGQWFIVDGMVGVIKK